MGRSHGDQYGGVVHLSTERHCTTGRKMDRQDYDAGNARSLDSDVGINSIEGKQIGRGVHNNGVGYNGHGGRQNGQHQEDSKRS